MGQVRKPSLLFATLAISRYNRFQGPSANIPDEQLRKNGANTNTLSTHLASKHWPVKTTKESARVEKVRAILSVIKLLKGYFPL